MPVAVIGEDVYRRCSAPEDAIGKTINVGGAEVEVIGVMNRPAASIPGQDDNRVLCRTSPCTSCFPTRRKTC